ncbi:MAG: hypothetical protein H7335_17520 [Massilia sp.]|nr:hypothetical protein [Massilia sp.]
MGLLKSLFARWRQINQAQVIQRAATVIDRVIWDVGVNTLMAGTFVLDKSHRLRFCGMSIDHWPDVIASVTVSDIAEADLLRAVVATTPHDLTMLKAHSARLAHAVVRELTSRSRCNL